MRSAIVSHARRIGVVIEGLHIRRRWRQARQVISHPPEQNLRRSFGRFQSFVLEPGENESIHPDFAATFVLYFRQGGRRIG